ncbi:MAG: alpha/beta fold hydrolase [Streptosporangiaceae bacterium]
MNTTRWSAAVLVAGLLMTGGMSAAQAAPTTQAASASGGQARTADPGLAPFYHQHVRWHRCQLGPGDSEGRQLAGAQCADIRVPLDYAHPGRRAITIAISRLKADPSAKKIGAMIINIGGPATPVLSDVLLARQAMGATGARFDLIGMDQRFAGRSTPMNCHWPDGWLGRGAGASRASFNEMVRLSRDLAHRCARTERALLPFAGTANAARDMDVIRGALGERRLSFLGYSYGTYLGALYTQMFPGRAGRIVLDSAINPARQKALADWATWAAQHNAQYHLGGTARQVLATVNGVYRRQAVTRCTSARSRWMTRWCPPPSSTR